MGQVIHPPDGTHTVASTLGGYYQALIGAGVPEALAHDIVRDAAVKLHDGRLYDERNLGGE